MLAPMPTLTFRHASIDDMPAIVALVTAAYRGDSSRLGWTTEADLLDGQRVDISVLESDLTRPDSYVILAETTGGPDNAEDEAELVGCAHVCKDELGRGYFGMFAVDPRGQGAGLGKQILAEAERVAADLWSARTMTMSVIDLRADLIAFYERRGYRRTGVYKAFPYGDDRFGLPRRDDLRLEVLEKELTPGPR